MEMTYAELLGLRGELHFERLESEVLRGNPLGDAHVRPVVVYTPRGYDAQGSHRYPALYVLHGYVGNALGLVGGRAWETNVLQRADRLIEEGAMRPAIVAIVDGWTRLGGSQYVDSVHNGNYATYAVNEVIPFVDARYRTIARPGGRAVLGKSSGGFGAMHLVMEHPGTFAAVASHSGDSYFQLSHPRAFPSVQRTLETYGYAIESFVADFEKKNKRAQPEYETIEMLGYAAAYSPRSARAFDLDLPFDLKTGELRGDVFAKWLAFDPVERIPHRGTELGELRLRYVDCGRRDEYALDIGARLMAERMRELGLEVRHEEFDDDHRNVGYRYAVSMPALTAVLDEE